MVTCICGTKLTGNQRQFCSQKCRDRDKYLKHKERYIENAKKWKENNPKRAKEINKKAFKRFIDTKKERFNELMRLNYKKHPQEYLAHSNIYHNRDNILNKLGRDCMICNSISNLEIHHLDYTWSINKKNRKNYILNLHKLRILCRICHRKVHKKHNI